MYTYSIEELEIQKAIAQLVGDVDVESAILAYEEIINDESSLY